MVKRDIKFIDTGEFIVEEGDDIVVVGNIDPNFLEEETATKMAHGPELFDELKANVDFLRRTFGPERDAEANDYSRWTDRGAYDRWYAARDALNDATA